VRGADAPRFTGVGSVESRSHARRVARACSGRSGRRAFAPSLSPLWGYLWCKCCPDAFSAPNRPDLALDVPPAYRAGRGTSAPPKLDWWRGFHSAELTGLVEEAQTRNLDNRRRHRPHHRGRCPEQARTRPAAADRDAECDRPALARVADNGSRRRPAPGAGRRRATSTTPCSTPATRSTSGARNPRRVARRGGERHRQPLQQGGRRPLDRGQLSPRPISRCWRRRIGCGWRATISAPPAGFSR